MGLTGIFLFGHSVNVDLLFEGVIVAVAVVNICPVANCLLAGQEH
jgi:hypothetical protein